MPEAYMGTKRATYCKLCLCSEYYSDEDCECACHPKGEQSRQSGQDGENGEKPNGQSAPVQPVAGDPA